MKYRPYKGRRKRAGFALFVKVLAGLIVAAATVVLLLPGTVTLTPDGIMLNFSWLQPQNPPPESASPSAPPTPSDQSSLSPSPSSPEPSVSEEPTQEPAEKLYTVFVPASALADPARVEEYVQLVQNTRINALVLEMKTADGLLSYHSGLAQAQTAGAQAGGTDAVESAIERFRQENIPLIAQVSCFQDNLMPRKNKETAMVTANQVLWLDTDYTSWLNPYSASATDYLAGVVSELHALGFGEVLLTGLSFPDNGRLSLIDYGAQDEGGAGRYTAIGSFVDRLRQENPELRISALMDYTACTEGANPETGQSVSSLQYSLDRFFFAVPDEAMADTYTACKTGLEAAAGQVDLEAAVVPIIASPADAQSDGAGEVLQNSIGTAGGQDDLGFMVTHSEGIYPEGAFIY